MYAWEFNDPLVRAVFEDLPAVAQRGLRELMDALVLVDPMQYQRRPDERTGNLRTLHFGETGAGIVAVHVREPDLLVLVVQLQWIG